MKKYSPFICLLLLLAAGFTACYNDESTASSDKNKGNMQDIAEAPLPKGKPVIEDDKVNIGGNGTNDVTPLGNKKADHQNTRDTGTAPAKDWTMQLLKKKFKQLLIFHVDDTMTVEKPKLATLILGKDESPASAKLMLEDADAKENNIKKDTTMEFGSRMRARLVQFSGTKIDNNFEIEALGDAEQSFKNDRKKIMWQWKVTPLKPGQQELKLTVQVIEKDGEAILLPARNIQVVILVKPENFMAKVGNFFSTKTEWIITAIFLPLLIAWFTTRMRNKGGNHHHQQHGNKNNQV
jgi:hypothetical protein